MGGKVISNYEITQKWKGYKDKADNCGKVTHTVRQVTTVGSYNQQDNQSGKAGKVAC